MEIPLVLPYKIQSDPQIGRFLVASRDIKPLEIILFDTASVSAPSHKTEKVCLECLCCIDGSFLCHGCGYPMCDQACSSGPKHSRECRLLEKIKNESVIDNDGSEHQFNYRLIMTLRMLLLKREDSAVWTAVDTLMDHINERKENISEWTMFQKTVVDVIKKIFPDASDEELHRMIGIVCTNGYSFDFHKVKVKGRTVYPRLSLASHSCVSNAEKCISPVDLSVVLRARKFIEAGTQITINYVREPIFGMPNRKQHILKEWYFECECPRCSDNTEFGTYASALKCSQCREGLILPHSKEKGGLWRCRNCNNPFELEFISNFVQAIKDELFSLTKSNPTQEKLEQFIKGHFCDLHPNHYLNLIAQRNLIQILARDPQPTRVSLNKLVKYCKSYKATLSRLDPGYSQWMGFILKRIHAATLALLMFDLKEQKVDKNIFAEKSEAAWDAMKEKEKCDLLQRPVTYKK